MFLEDLCWSGASLWTGTCGAECGLLEIGRFLVRFKVGVEGVDAERRFSSRLLARSGVDVNGDLAWRDCFRFDEPDRRAIDFLLRLLVAYFLEMELDLERIDEAMLLKD